MTEKLSTTEARMILSTVIGEGGDAMPPLTHRQPEHHDVALVFRHDGGMEVFCQINEGDSEHAVLSKSMRGLVALAAGRGIRELDQFVELLKDVHGDTLSIVDGALPN